MSRSNVEGVRLRKEQEEDCPENPNSPYITQELCKAYRKSLSKQLSDQKEFLDKIDSRLWQLLGGVILTILLSIATIIITLVK